MKPCTCPTCTEPLVITCANRCANAADGASVTSFGYQKHLRAVHTIPVREERPVARPAVDYPRQRARQVPREVSRQRVMALLGDTSVVTAQMLVTRFDYTIGTAYNILSDLVAEGALERDRPGCYRAKSEVLA